jgi:hypothetical protein
MGRNSNAYVIGKKARGKETTKKAMPWVGAKY